jgi:hypothetical protein
MSLVEALAPANAPKTACEPVQLPEPWDPTYQSLFGQALAALTSHLAGLADSATVVELKVTGVNDSTDETLMPFSKGGTIGCNSGSSCQMDAGGGNGWCTESDGVAVITDAGYGTTTAESSFTLFAQDLRTDAPGLTLGSQVSAALPNPGSGDLAEEIVDQFIANASLPPITVQDNGLRAVSGVDPGTLDAAAAGVAVGFQEYLGVAGDTACKMSQGLKVGPLWDGGCGNEQVLDVEIWNGLDAGASFLELYQLDVQTFPNACAMAHAAMVP